jgi:hypothetical protein
MDPGGARLRTWAQRARGTAARAGRTAAGAPSAHLGRSDAVTETSRKAADGPHDVLAAEEFVVPAPDPGLHGDGPHDVLAAEEFVVPAPDPGLHVDHPHDVLAAEEFELGAADPVLHHGRVTPPPDPSGIAEPHDVLAAEEFAVPAGRGGDAAPGSWTAVAMRGPRAGGASRAAGLLLLGALAARLLRRRRG